MQDGIFISYRRDDARQAAGRLADDLAREWGAQRIFRDIERIELGVDFEQALNQALESCQIMLVLIGKQWATICDANGQRRLDQHGDWIRTEIATALRRNIRVVPVLIDGAPMPEASALPEDIRKLVGRQGFKIDDERWHSDVRSLVNGLSHLSGISLPKAGSPVPAASESGGLAKHKGKLALAAVVVALVAAYKFRPPAPTEEESPATSQTQASNTVVAQESAPAPAGPVGTWVYQGKDQETRLEIRSQSDGVFTIRQFVNDQPRQTITATFADDTLSYEADSMVYGRCDLKLQPGAQSLRGTCIEKSSGKAWPFSFIKR